MTVKIYQTTIQNIPNDHTKYTKRPYKIYQTTVKIYQHFNLATLDFFLLWNFFVEPSSPGKSQAYVRAATSCFAKPHNDSLLKTFLASCPARVARLFLQQHTKTGKKCITNNKKIYQMAIKYI
jgi:hypothetical protein